ncbi:MAG: 4-alpha-glucanotransferase [Thiotrichaceae bacterium]|nr:4-alpha-glucanotransferase [Thiotrichaceae bacterium]
MNQDFFKKRRAGILLHPTSLPGKGDLGQEAYNFVDFLANSGISLWQMLPLGPPHDDLSPYQCQSVHAANPVLISLEHLVKKGWITEQSSLKEARIGFEKNANQADRAAFLAFIEEHKYWLEDYALFRALRLEHNNVAWWDWSPDLRDRVPQALKAAKLRLKSIIEQNRFEQFVFFSQWHELKEYAHEKGVYLFGDIPIFVAEDSADVWACRENFLLDAEGKATIVAGVPPDYFSETGQRWGNPHYNWDYMQENGFSWWRERLKSANLLFDVARIDHFRGFEASWAIPASCKTAIEGEWIKVPGEALFNTLTDIDLPLVAEDLGIITREVTALREKFGLPGMKILQFAFDGGNDNPYLPHNLIEECIVYTGTHDNNTTLGWFNELPEHTQHYVCDYLHVASNDMPWSLIEAAFASVAQWAIIPMQDVLALDGTHRMNIPSVEKGNWCWRFEWSQLPPDINNNLRQLCNDSGR